LPVWSTNTDTSYPSSGWFLTDSAGGKLPRCPSPALTGQSDDSPSAPITVTRRSSSAFRRTDARVFFIQQSHQVFVVGRIPPRLVVEAGAGQIHQVALLKNRYCGVGFYQQIGQLKVENDWLKKNLNCSGKGKSRNWEMWTYFEPLSGLNLSPTPS